MVTTAAIAATAALIGDPARAAMLHALMDGRALTAGELAAVAGVAPSTASSHLAQLTAAGLLAVERQGRHRYHRLAAPRVAGLIEGLMQVAGDARTTATATGPRDAALRLARTCYDHLAGRLGVALADALARREFVMLSDEAGVVTPAGLRFFEELGLDAGAGRRPFCRPCLDWSERRLHLAGRLGAALCRRSLEAGWLRPRAGSRALDITPPGQRAFKDVFGADWRA